MKMTAGTEFVGVELLVAWVKEHRLRLLRLVVGFVSVEVDMTILCVYSDGVC
jgi:hypothetical protein